jgi:hypothetical protein
MDVDAKLHDHHHRRADPHAVTPQATTPPHPGTDPLADNDPTKTVTPTQAAGGFVLLAVGLASVLVLFVAVLLLLRG